MGRREIKVAIVDNSIYPSVYKPVEHWAGVLGVRWDAYRAPEGRLPGLKRGYTHLLLTGSEASILEREPWVQAEVRLIREAVENGLPILGSCYGHQLIALALGGPGRVRRSARPEVGWIPVLLGRRSGLLGGRGLIHAFSSHFDEVRGPGDDFLVLASTPDCAIQAFKLKRRPVCGIQFHPEMDVSAAREFLAGLVRMGVPASALFAGALASRPRDSGVIKRVVRYFLDSAETKPEGRGTSRGSDTAGFLDKA